MNDFKLYFSLGIDHILTWAAMDHILFVAALCLRYLLNDWRKVAVLVTAFTIGHSVTLALSALNYIHVPAPWIEFFIPLTIAATALNNLCLKKADIQKRLPLIYFFALFFGLIHGLAYASSFLDLEGRENLTVHLFAFNVGIELAQLLVVAGVLFVSFLLVQLPVILTANKKDQVDNPLRWPSLLRLSWIRIASLVILAFSLYMAFERFPHKKNTHYEKTAFIYLYNDGHVQPGERAEHTEQPWFKPRKQV